MLRYIMGISLITIGILIVRALSNGKVLKRHQYAFWIVIPVFMLLSPFIKISIPVNLDLNNLFPSKVQTSTAETVSEVPSAVIVPDEINENFQPVDDHSTWKSFRDTPEATQQLMQNNLNSLTAKILGDEDKGVGLSAMLAMAATAASTFRPRPRLAS